MLIAFTGKSGSGKDTAAEYFAGKYGFHGTSFAAALKASARIKFALSSWHTDTQEGKQTFIPTFGKTVRELLQMEGTEAGRDVYGDDFWVKRWEMGYQVLKESGINLITVSDCRFPEEAEAIIELGGWIIRLERPGAGLPGELGQHRSEAPLDENYIDFTVYNDGDIEVLHKRLSHVMRCIIEEEG